MTQNLTHRSSLLPTLALAALTVLVLATTSFAGGGPGPSGPASGPGSVVGTGPGTGVSAVDASQAVVLEGPVVSFLAGPGSALPTLTVDDPALGATAVRLGPFWFLTEAGWAAEVGDIVRITAFPCSLCTAGYVAAKVENLSTGIGVDLRAEDGAPLWPAGHPRGTALGTRGQGKNGSPGGSGCLGACTGWTFDFSAAATVTGTVIAFTGGPGVGMPLLTLEADGETLLLAAGPWHVWQAAGYLPAAGDRLTVTYVPANQADESFLVATQVIETATGLTVILRDPEAVRAGCPRR